MTKQEIQSKIERLKKAIAATREEDQKKEFQNGIDKLEKMLSDLDKAEEKVKKAEKGKGKKTEEQDETLEEIKELEEIISETENPKEKALYEKKLNELKAKIQTEKKEVKIAEKKVEKAEEEKKAVAKKVKKVAAEKPIKAVVEKAVKVKKQAKEQKDRIIIVDGKKYDLDKCDDAIAALEARRKQAKKTGKKFKTKKPASKASANIETAIKQVVQSIPKEKMEDNPERVIAALKEFDSNMRKAFTALSKILPKEDVATLRESLDKIKEVVAKLK
jgi:hypothetical protein